MIEFTEYRPLHKYPHMSREDTQIWERYIAQHPKIFTQAAYDVKVGEGQTPPPTLKEPYVKMVADLSKKRIDVLATDGHQLYIIEVKPHAALSAVGQIILYHHLLPKDIFQELPRQMVLLCRTHDPDITSYCKKERIEIWTI